MSDEGLREAALRRAQDLALHIHNQAQAHHFTWEDVFAVFGPPQTPREITEEVEAGVALTVICEAGEDDEGIVEAVFED